MTPPMNRRPTDVSVTAAKMTIVIDGGIRMPSVPAFTITPVAKAWV